MLHGQYPVSVKDQGIPASDCAGKVIALGSAVSKVSLRDRVSPIFDLRYIDVIDAENKVAQLGGNVDGVLRQYAVFDENALVRIPQHLSWAEDQISPGGIKFLKELILKLYAGTGGVSLFALLICLGAGIRPIITSSSNKKLQDVTAFASDGVVDTVNYREYPNWEEKVIQLTHGKGVDTVLETVGDTSMQKSITSMSTRGQISWIGFLGGLQLDNSVKPLGELFLKVGTLKAIQVGSKIDQENLCHFLEENHVSLKPIIGKTFDFTESPAAFDFLYSGQCLGKVVITVSH
ncbi:alcohol dehydrogenase [Penicillium angulare]|uniref:alcohol dehydrogenase n=1 Tax=Penicillium angulare TaxID=116970 RepID=UPI0025403A20|nr:alcohol dehydrogenase [Penicillium angulare]KAJ5273615.1 alcohol dehydrogenase [Penicillium angulare]